MEDERRLFDKYDEFSAIQRSFLAIDLNSEPTASEGKEEVALLTKLSEILDEYQEQSYLLDPVFEHLVTPVAVQLKAHAQVAVSEYNPQPKSNRCASSARVGRLALLLYSYVKFRGHKTIIRYFPHEVADLPIALAYMHLHTGPISDSENWALRYVVLLWLGLVCMLPFDLAQFNDDSHNDDADEGNQLGGSVEPTTAGRLESLARRFLGKPGLERDSAAILLARLYTRSDTRSRFHLFLEWSICLPTEDLDVFTAIGVLQVVCEVIKSGSAEQSSAHLVLISQLSDMIGNRPTLASNMVVRKLKMKLLGRLALRLLPVRSRGTRQRARILTLSGGESDGEHDDMDEDIEIPVDVEVALEELFRGLQDNTTIVRWSASKGIARISERLPNGFVDQVMDTITSLFSIHSIAAASIYDIPTIAESTWHGACLGCAEMARRGLVAHQKIPELLGWLSKALYFDIRKGAHSIGSNVRDAAAYVLWALARTQSTSTFAVHANDVACNLVSVALFDREIHVRRAASATFQEHVGRMNLFPHGIDVLGKVDFYSVSVRRNAFLIAAPQVADLAKLCDSHVEYRKCLFDHILNITLRHWDSSMRELGAQSLSRMCEAEILTLGPDSVRRAAQLFGSIDVNDIHGGLLALTEIAASYRGSEMSGKREEYLRETFRYLASIPSTIVQSPRNELVAAASCRLIANSITLAEIELGEQSQVPLWRKIVENSLKHRNSTVQEAAADAMAAVSTLIPELRSGYLMVQQSLGRFIGCLDYASHPHGLKKALGCLLECLEGPLQRRLTNIEARRNCYLAMPKILNNVSSRLTYHMTADIVRKLFDALLHGLEDYSMDERGDVGSWIRIACTGGLASFSEILFSNAANIPNFEEYLPPDRFHDAVGGILKQGVERLDGVRQEAGDKFHRMLQLPMPAIASAEPWRIHGFTLMQQLFLSLPQNEIPGWNDGSWLFPKAVQLLEVERYRKQILSGLVLSIDSKTDSTQRFASSSLVAYARSLPLEGSKYCLSLLARDLVDQAQSRISSNAIVIPVLRTFNVLLEADVLARLARCSDGLDSLRSLYAIASWNIPRLKNMQRIIESMKVIVHLIPFEMLFKPCTSVLPSFLAHQLPKVRTDTAEYFYNTLQTMDLSFDTDDVETILLETEWSIADINISIDAADRIAGLLSLRRLD